MPKKINANTLNVTEVDDQQHVINLFTKNKKAHFNVSEAKLYETLMFHINDQYKLYSVYLSTTPFIAVHISCRTDVILREKEQLVNKVHLALESCFDDGTSKIKR